MRIIAGRFKGYRLPSPRSKGVRPTADRVREAVFSILGSRTVGVRVLDLFAGSGGYGFEALSRGAAGAVFVDSDRLLCKVLSESAQRLGVGEDSDVINLDALKAVRRLAERRERFGLVFLDPPYGSDLVTRVFAVPEFAALVDEQSTVVLESSDREPAAELPGTLEKVLEKRYGDTVVAILRVHLPSLEIQTREGEETCP